MVDCVCNKCVHVRHMFMLCTRKSRLDLDIWHKNLWQVEVSIVSHKLARNLKFPWNFSQCILLSQRVWKWSQLASTAVRGAIPYINQGWKVHCDLLKLGSHDVVAEIVCCNLSRKETFGQTDGSLYGLMCNVQYVLWSWLMGYCEHSELFSLRILSCYWYLIVFADDCTVFSDVRIMLTWVSYRCVMSSLTFVFLCPHRKCRFWEWHDCSDVFISSTTVVEAFVNSSLSRKGVTAIFGCHQRKWIIQSS